MKKKIISLPPTYFYLCILINLGTLLLPNIKKTITYPVNLSGILILILGIYLILKPYYMFKKHDTPENFKRSTSVVKEGIFRYSRNPMYVGAIIFLIGLAVLIGKIIGFITPILLFAILNFMFIPYEEEKMEKEIGKEYLDYKKKVRRWI